MPSIETTLHEIAELDGIGVALAGELRALGFVYAEDLLARDDLAIASDIEPVQGISRSQALTSLLPQARLLRLPGMSAAVSKAWLEHGLTDYRNVAWLSAEALLDWAQDVSPSTTAAEVASWQLDAARRSAAATLTVEVVSHEGRLIEGAQVEAANAVATGYSDVWSWRTRYGGPALLEYLQPGALWLAVWAEGHATQSLVLQLEPRSYQSITLQLQAGAGDGVVVDEFVDEVQLLDDGYPMKRVTLDSLDELPGADGFVVTARSADTARLTSLRMRQVGMWHESYSVSVAASQLPSGVEVQSVVESAGDGSFVLVEDTSWRAWRHEKRSAS